MSANLQTIEPQAIIPSEIAFPLSAASKRKFFRELISTGGHLSKACKLAGVSRQRVLQWRNEDADFAQQYDDAIEHGTENLEEIAYRRAMKSSDTLIQFLLKARRPTVYRENIKIDSEVSLNQDSAISFADTLIARILQRKQEAAALEANTHDVGVGPMGHVQDIDND